MNIVKPAYLAAVVGFLGAVAVNARAEEKMSEQKPEKSAFSQIDADGDGIISTREANEKNSWLARNFKAIDTDRDGRISKTEYERALG